MILKTLFGCHFLENGQQRVRPEAGDPFKMLFRWPERKMMRTCTRIGVLDGYGGTQEFPETALVSDWIWEKEKEGKICKISAQAIRFMRISFAEKKNIVFCFTLFFIKKKKQKKVQGMLIVPLGHVVWNIKLKMSRREVGIYGLSSNCFLADDTLGLESMNAF